MSNCFRMDLKRSIFCKKFCAVVLGVLIVLIISTWDSSNLSSVCNFAVSIFCGNLLPEQTNHDNGFTGK